MESLIAVLLLLVGIAAGAGAAWLLRGREIAIEREAHRQEMAALIELRGDIDQHLRTDRTLERGDLGVHHRLDGRVVDANRLERGDDRRVGRGVAGDERNEFGMDRRKPKAGRSST